MATGRIRRSARRGLSVAVLGWLGVAAFSVLMAPSATAAPSATVEIRNVTPPAASVDKGGTVTFVNQIPAQNKGGIDLGPLVGTVSATVYTDVAVSFFGQNRGLQTGQSTAWTFNDPATNGTITYTYRIVPQAGLAAAVANQVVSTVAGQLPALPAPVPYVVQTIAPNVPTLPSVNLPQLPQVSVPALPLPGGQAPQIPGGPDTTNPLTPPGQTPAGGPAPQGLPGGYQYDTGVGAAQLSPSAVAAAAAFDPSRYYVPGSSLGGPDRNDNRGSGNGSGGVAGGYDGASVPVFGQLAGLDGSGLDEQNAQETASSSSTGSSALPAAALAAVVALAAVTAALVRTHQASRSSK